jgi:lysophospholipase L1-like esterase
MRFRPSIVMIPCLLSLWTACSRHEDIPTLLFLGDSITEAEYFVKDTEMCSQSPMRAIPRGRGSETASGLTEAQFKGLRPWVGDRLTEELRRFDPDWVVLCYGMNCGLFQPFDSERFHAYQTGMTHMVRTSLAAGARVVLLTPPPFARAGAVTSQFEHLDQRIRATEMAHARGSAKASDDPARYGYDSPYLYYDDVLAVYSAWLTTLDQPGRVWVVDMREPLLKAKERAYDQDDPVHPNREGHRLMAEAFCSAWSRIGERTQE